MDFWVKKQNTILSTTSVSLLPHCLVFNNMTRIPQNALWKFPIPGGWILMVLETLSSSSLYPSFPTKQSLLFSSQVKKEAKWNRFGLLCSRLWMSHLIVEGLWAERTPQGCQGRARWRVWGGLLSSQSRLDSLWGQWSLVVETADSLLGDSQVPTMAATGGKGLSLRMLKIGIHHYPYYSTEGQPGQ